MRIIALFVLLLALASVVQAQTQGDYNAGVLAGIKVGWNVIQALLQKDDAAYQTTVESWNSLVRTTGDQTYILPEGKLHYPASHYYPAHAVLSGMGSQGNTLTKPYHSFDPSVMGMGMAIGSLQSEAWRGLDFLWSHAPAFF